MVEQMLVLLKEEKRKRELRQKERRKNRSKASSKTPVKTTLNNVKSRSYNRFLRDIQGNLSGKTRKATRKKAKANGWPAEPLISGEWLELKDEQVAEFDKVARKEKAKALKGLDFVAMRVMPLPFYEHGLLLEVLLHTNQNPFGVFRAILAKSFFVAIDGTSPPIHSLNSKRLKFRDVQDRLTYLHLFCSAVRGDEGRFRIVEARPNIENLSAEIDVEAVTVKPLDEDSTSREFSAHILYSNALFLADFAVMENGMVEMLDDEPLAADLEVDQEAFDPSGCIQLFHAAPPGK